jgi:hypothetical protein
MGGRASIGGGGVQGERREISEPAGGKHDAVLSASFPDPLAITLAQQAILQAEGAAHRHQHGPAWRDQAAR